MVKKILKYVTIAVAAALIFLGALVIAKFNKLNSLKERADLAIESNPENLTIAQIANLKKERENVKEDLISFANTFAIISIVESGFVITTIILDLTLKDKSKPSTLNNYR